VIAVDTNILVYAHREELHEHLRARVKITEFAEGDVPWGIPVFCIGEFVRVVTHPKLFDPPYSGGEACDAVDRLLESPSLRILSPGPGYLSLFEEAVREANAIGNLVFDAQIVAVCRESGVSALLTEDRDFARFQGFRTRRLG
jgi:toxin-antitoxin system PIN domain toxin